MTIQHIENEYLNAKRQPVRTNDGAPQAAWHRPTLTRIALKNTAAVIAGSQPSWTDLHVCVS